MSVRPAKTQISLGIRPVWSESSLCDQWVAKDSRFLDADREDSDQTGLFLHADSEDWSMLNYYYLVNTLNSLQLFLLFMDAHNFLDRMRS